ncbi:MAG: NADH-quinone oxidoreductase subunit NuoN [Pseudomonadota bacterium]
MACVVLVVDLYIREQRRGLVHLLSILTLIFAALATSRGFGTDAVTGVAMAGSFVRDLFGDVLKLFVYLTMAIVFFCAKPYLRARSLFKGEFYALTLFGMLGMMVMISAGDLISLYLGLELLALTSYALVALDRDSGVASESAMKYFVLGAIASGMLLYGMSMLYGATGTLALSEIAAGLGSNPGSDPFLAFGLVFIVIGLAFKFGAVPFHMWLPDVYEGSPTAVTIFLAGAPKIAAFAMAIRLLDDGLGGLHVEWQQMLIILAVLSMAIGNVVAIAQTNLKRMLAYSTISHVGFMLVGTETGTETGFEAAMYYAIVYAIMSVGALGMIVVLSRAGFEADRVEDFKGLNQRNPWLAFVMLMFMASLAGFPPFVGFFAKLEVLKAAVDADLVWLAAVAVFFAIIGAFYYLRVIKVMYMDPPESETPIDAPFDLRAVISAGGLAQLGLGLFPGPLLALCAAAF